MILGVPGNRLTSVPRCIDLPCLATKDRLLGARYVIEGSTLGGRELARGLDALLGPGRVEGRRFFNGHGAETGPNWRRFVSELETRHNNASWAAALEASCETFLAFEAWLEDWKAARDE